MTTRTTNPGPGIGLDRPQDTATGCQVHLLTSAAGTLVLGLEFTRTSELEQLLAA